MVSGSNTLVAQGQLCMNTSRHMNITVSIDQLTTAFAPSINLLTNLSILEVLKDLLKYSCPSYPTDTIKQM